MQASEIRKGDLCAVRAWTPEGAMGRWNNKHRLQAMEKENPMNDIEARARACPFCGESAEVDTQESYRQFNSGRLGTSIAVYCTRCPARIGICREDVPDIEPQQVIALWNTRAEVELERKRILEALEHKMRTGGTLAFMAAYPEVKKIIEGDK